MSLIGKKAYIKANIDSVHAGGWGEIVWECGGEYHIAMYGDKDYCPIFTRNEFVVHRERKGGKQ